MLRSAPRLLPAKECSSSTITNSVFDEMLRVTFLCQQNSQRFRRSDKKGGWLVTKSGPFGCRVSPVRK